MPNIPLKVSDPDMQFIFDLVVEEMNKAITKHPQWPSNVVEMAAIVTEEAGEVIREANHIREGIGSIEDVRKELIHTAGTAIRMLRILYPNL